MQDTDKTKGIMLAYEVFYGLRSNQFKDLTLEEFDGFRKTMAALLQLKKED